MVSSKYLVAPKIKITQPELFVIVYFIAMSLEYPFQYYARNGYAWAMLVSSTFIVLLFAFPLIMLWFSRPKLTLYRCLFLCVFTGICLITMWNMTHDFNGFSVAGRIGVYFAMLGAFFMKEIRYEVLLKAFVPIAVMGIAALLGIVLFGNINLALAEMRHYTWTPIFFYASLYWACVPFALVAFFTKKHMWLSVIYGMCTIGYFMIFIKRAIFIDIFLLIVVLFAAYILDGKISFQKLGKFLTIALIFGLTSIIILNSGLSILVQGVVSRFMREDISNFSRFVESRNYLSSASTLEIFLGKGFQGTHYGLERQGSALHTGWTNFILKGGIPLFLLVFIPYFKALRLMPKFSRLPSKIKFSLCMMGVGGGMLVYQNMHDMTPMMMIYFYSIFNVMDYSSSSYPYSTHYRGNIIE